LPTAVFEAQIPDDLNFRAISVLADRFEASLTATVLRCAQLRSACAFGVEDERVTWGYGGIRPQGLIHLPDEVRDNVEVVMAGGKPERRVFFYARGSRGEYRRFDWIRMRNGSAMFLLLQDDPVRVSP
jgi:hypothetical protein